MSDSVTQEILAEAVGQRVGGMGLSGAASFQWSDAQNAMDYWAERIPQRLLESRTQMPQAHDSTRFKMTSAERNL
jgi:hypothetical protein